MENFISTLWLNENLSNPDIQIIDGSWHMPATARNAKAEYENEHIPGAIFFDIDDIADHATDLPHMLPSTEQFNTQLSKLGLDKSKTLVVYDTVGLFSAPRVWWTLKTFGCTNVKILEGGLPKWKSEKLATSKGLETKPESNFEGKKIQEAVVSYDQMIKCVENQTAQVLDARPAGRFTGEVPEPRPGLRGGHMPGAINVPVSELMQTNGYSFKSETDLKNLFLTKGVDLSQPIVTTCGSGVTAATLLLALLQAGAQNLKLYDGSWAQWGQISGGGFVQDNL